MKNPADADGGLSIGKTWECCGGSTTREVRRDVVEGRKSVESLEGHSYHELRLEGILYPTTRINPHYELMIMDVFQRSLVVAQASDLYGYPHETLI